MLPASCFIYAYTLPNVSGYMQHSPRLKLASHLPLMLLCRR